MILPHVVIFRLGQPKITQRIPALTLPYYVFLLYHFSYNTFLSTVGPLTTHNIYV